MRPAELAALGRWLSPAQLALFRTMPRADQRHGLDVVSALAAAGYDEPDLRLAGLLHDVAKGPTVRLWHRVAWSLGERYGPGVGDRLAALPGFAAPFDRLRHHAARSAELALAAGCSPRVAALIRAQAGPLDPASGVDPRLGEALRLADDAS
ncbi:MAG TPA: hypothetical protein VMH24_06815 [Candidatus Sulfotelmatobacter sp.]|nr:hypothetical protein [Candidatus Sulfotelmatobacter sp.]